MSMNKDQLNAVTQEELRTQVAALFKGNGYAIERPPKSHDSGADLLVKRHRDDDSLESVAIQVRKLARKVTQKSFMLCVVFTKLFVKDGVVPVLVWLTTPLISRTVHV